jgi:uncharacterized membrane protein
MPQQPGPSRASTPFREVLPRIVPTLMLLGACGGSSAAAIGLIGNPHVGHFAAWNVAPPGMLGALTLLAVTGGLLPMIAAAVAFARRPDSLARIERLSRIASPAVLIMPLALLFDWRVFRFNEPICVLFAMIVGLALEGTVRVALAAIGRDRIETFKARVTGWMSVRAARALAGACLGLAVAAFAAWMSHHALGQHYRIQTNSFDLAIYDNMMWNLLHGGWFRSYPEMPDGTSHLAVHATLIAPLLLPFYAIAQKPQTLLVVQAMICAAGAIPIYLLTVLRLQSRAAGLLLACCTLLYAPLQQAMMYDFHFITLAPFFVGFTVWALESGKRLLLVVFFVLTLLVREDVAATMTVAAFAYMLAGVRPAWSATGFLVGAAWFLGIKFLLMPSLHHGEVAFTGLYFHLGRPEQPGMARVVQTILLNPVFTLITLAWPLKLVFVCKVCTPVLLLPFRHKRAWLLLLPGMVFTVLTFAAPAFSTAFQHATHWTALLFIAALWVLSDWRVRADGWCRIPAAMIALGVIGAALSYQYGIVFQHHTFVAGFRKIELPLRAQDQRNHDDLYALIRQIPPQASVTATESEAPQVSARQRCYTMRMGNPAADYLLLSTVEAGEGESRDVMRIAIESGAYGWIASKGQYDLWGRGASQEQNAIGAARIRLDAP